MKKEKKYFAVYDKNYACMLRWLTGMSYYTYTCDNGEKSFSFEYTDELIKAMEIAREMKKKFR